MTCIVTNGLGLFVFLLSLTSCSHSNNELTIACASNLAPAMEELAEAFTKETGTKLNLSYGATGLLYQQVKNGAPIDIMISANPDYTGQLFKEEKVQDVLEFAKGQVVLVSKYNLDRATIVDYLLSDECRKIVIPDWRKAPFGMAAKSYLEEVGIWTKVSNKLLITDDVSKANTMYLAGNGDALFTANSLTNKLDDYFVTIIGKELQLEQSALIINGAVHAEEAKAFLKFLRSASAKEILKKYNYLV